MLKLIPVLTSLAVVSNAFGISLRDSTRSQPEAHAQLKPTRAPQLPFSAGTGPVTPATVSPSSFRPSSTLCNVKIFRKLRLPWMDAFGACKALGNGSDLISLRNEEDYLLVTSALKDFDSPLPVIFWTSGVDLVEEGVFTWMSDGTGVNMSQFWSNGQPDNLWDSEHCLGLRRRGFTKEYKMTDENCHLAGAFICAQICA